MTYGFDLPDRVRNEILDCALYIADDNVNRAVQWMDRTVEQIRSICELPHAYAVDEIVSREIGVEVRRRSIGNYTIHFEIDEVQKTVIAVRFRHAARGGR